MTIFNSGSLCKKLRHLGIFSTLKMRMLNLSSYVNLTNLRHGHETLAIHTAVLHKIDNDLKST